VDGGRVVLNRKLEPVANVFSIVRAARTLWQAYTIKYEDGIRLVRTDRIQWLVDQIGLLRGQLEVAKAELYDAWDDVKLEARERLGDLYVASDYAFDPRDAVWILLTFPSVDPDRRLLQVAPEIFESEKKRIEAKLQEAATIAEAGLQEQLAELVGSLAERLSEGEREDGKKRYVRQAAIDEIVEFSNRFRAVSVGSNAELDAIVERARALAGDTNMEAVRKDAGARATVAGAFAAMRADLDKFVAVKKERNFE
jgi:hypothetical protein